MGMYKPSDKEVTARRRAYDQLDAMRKLKDQKMPHFANQLGERSFNQYIDDSERIVNGYVRSREAQGKDEWQSNMLDNITRAKLRAIVSGVALKAPESVFQATNKDGIQSSARASIFKGIVNQTYNDGNPALHAFLETWTMLSHGVIFEYEGYQTGGAQIRRVKSFDSKTGDVEEESVYVDGESKPFAAILDPQEFYWWDMYIRDLQDQPHIAWCQHYTKSQLEREFSKYPNYKFVKDKSGAARLSADQQETLYLKRWSSIVNETDDYLVFRRYSIEDDAYEIWINGVPMLLAPLIWGDKKKYYPFAKAISEPFANTNFFVGMSLPAILEAYQDGKNDVINTMIDKLYRSMEAPMLIGLANKDIFDVEDEFVTQGNRYYVPDVNAVKPMPISGVNQGELAMLTILDRGIEALSIDRSQQGQAPSTQRTARDAVIADRNAQQLKTMLYLFLEDLWLQKTRLRTRTIITHYFKDKAARKSLKENIITVRGFTFGNGERGTLDIHIAKNAQSLLSVDEIMAREMAAEAQGQVYKLISVPMDYVDDWEFDFQIVPKSFHDQDKDARAEQLKEEVQWMTTIFPEFFVANKDKYLAKSLEMYDEHPEDFNPPAQMPAAPASGPDGAPAAGASPIDEGMAALPAPDIIQ